MSLWVALAVATGVDLGLGVPGVFEPAVAVATGLFGLSSGAASVTVVGVLIEVPVMLSLVAFANRTRAWFPASSRA